MPTSRSRNILLANRQIAHIIYYNNVLLSFCTCLEKHTDRLQFDLYTASAGKHMWVSTKAAQCWYIHDGTAARGGWGMQAATEMQVIGLTLNRCDSLLERQTGSRNTTKHRAGAGSTPEEPFPASHGDNAENTAFKCNTQTEPAIKRHRVRHSSETDRVHEQRSTAAFTSVHPATYLHLSVDHHRGGRGSVHLTAQCFIFTPSPGVLVVFRAALCNICVEYQQLLSTSQHKAPGSDRTENLIHTNWDLHICL